MFSKIGFAFAAFVSIAAAPIAHASDAVVSRERLENELGYTCFGPASDGYSYCVNGGSGPGYRCDSAGNCTVYTGLISGTRGYRFVAAPAAVGSFVASPQPTSNPLGMVAVPLRATVR